MTKTIMKKSYGKELKLLDNLAAFYIDTCVHGTNHLIHTENQIQILEDVKNRSITIRTSLVDNGCDWDQAFDFVNSFKSLGRLI